MPAERYVVLGLAPARAAWFRDVARWATSASLPLEFLKCVSAEELRARLASGRPISAVLVDAGAPGADRDLCDTVRLAGPYIVGRMSLDVRRCQAVGREMLRKIDILRDEIDS